MLCLNMRIIRATGGMFTGSIFSVLDCLKNAAFVIASEWNARGNPVFKHRLRDCFVPLPAGLAMTFLDGLETELEGLSTNK